MRTQAAELESSAQISARRAAHRDLWQQVPCDTCGAAAGHPCTIGPAFLAHSARIKAAHPVAGWGRLG